MTFKVKNGLQVGDNQVIDSSGNILTSTAKLTTPRNITLTGSVSGSATFDGSQDITITTSGGGGSASITQTTPTYVASGGTTTVSGKTILSAYEQQAGTTLNVNYTTEGDYVQEDSTKTDFTSGTITLSSSGGSSIDTNTTLMLHLDGSAGDTKFVDSRYGFVSGYFDGTTPSKLTIPSSYKTSFGTSQNFTIEFWFKAEKLGVGQRLVDFRDNNGENGTAKPQFDINGNGTITVWVQNTNRITTSAISANTWYHFAYVRNSGTTTLYLNGTSAGSWADSLSFPNCYVTIGDAVGGTMPFFGNLGEFRISNIARYTGSFSPSSTPHTRDANTVYLFHFGDGHGSQVPKDDSRSGTPNDLGANTGSNITTSDYKFGTSCLSMDGTSNAGINFPSPKEHIDFDITTGDFTLDFWFKATTVHRARLVDMGNAYYSYCPTIWIKSNGQIGLDLSNNGTSYNLSANSTDRGAYSAGAWTHVALTRSGTNVYLFISGTLSATIPVGSAALSQSTMHFCFGRRNNDSADPYNGKYDEIRYKKGIAEWTATFTPPTSQYTTDDRTVLLMHFDGANNDKVTLDSSENGTMNPANSTTVGQNLVFFSNSSLQSTQTRGGHGTSLYCDGTTNGGTSLIIAANDLVTGHPLKLGSSNDYFCVEGWFYDNGDTDAGYFNFTDQTTGTKWSVYKTGINQIKCDLAGITMTSGNITLGWNHVAAVREPRGYVFYVNGTATASPTSPQTNVSYTASNTHYFVIGRWDYNLSTQYFLNGYVDSVRITNGKPRYTANFTPATLTQDSDTTMMWTFDGSVGQKWVKELSKNTSIIATTNFRTVDDGKYVYAELGQSTTLPFVSTGQTKFGTTSLYFDGTGNSLVLPAFVPSGDYTIDFWYRPINTSTISRILFHGSNGTNASFGLQIVVNASGQMQFFHNYDTSANAYGMTSNTAMSNNTWYHFAFVRSGTTLYMFQNGVQVATVSAPTTLNSSAGTLRLGRLDNSNSLYLYGYIDEFRLSTNARWTSGFTPPTSPYGTSYVTGPAYITTTNTSRINMTGYDGVYSCAVTETLNPGSTTRYFVSFDGRTTWKTSTDNGVTWTPYALSSANLISYGMTASQLQNALVGSASSVFGQYIDIAAVLQTSNTSFSPSIDNINIGFDQYQTMQLGVDYNIKKSQASGTQTLTFTRLKSGNANHTFDII